MINSDLLHLFAVEALGRVSVVRLVFPVDDVAQSQLRVQRRPVGGAVVQTGLFTRRKTVPKPVHLVPSQRRTGPLNLTLHRLLQLRRKDRNKI